VKLSEKELSCLIPKLGWVDERGLNIRLDTASVEGLCILNKICGAVARPTTAFGGAYADTAYLWITIPLTKIEKSISFNNDPPKRKKAKS
jgi:hypothetical protein